MRKGKNGKKERGEAIGGKEREKSGKVRMRTTETGKEYISQKYRSQTKVHHVEKEKERKV